MPSTLTEPKLADIDVNAERFTAHLDRHACDFFPELNSANTTVRIVHHTQRHHSQLLELDVTDGSRSRRVIYKIPFSLQHLDTTEFESTSRPRLFPEIQPVTNGLREFRALESIEHHFRSLHDDRFGVISMLELLELPYVVVMEKSPDGDLKSLLKRATWFHRNSNSSLLNRAFENTGAWLREFHKLPDLDHTVARHEHRDCFVDAAKMFTGGLVQQLGRHFFFDRLCRQLITSATRHLPDYLPCSVVHGDFAPRNVLVADDSRITVFDTQRRWRAPLYEDLAYFLMSLKTPGPQVRSQGSLFSQAQLARWESAFLGGYFQGCEVQHKAVRIYECLLTLEWWGAINFRQSEGSFSERAALALSNRYLSRYVTQLIAEI